MTKKRIISKSLKKSLPLLKTVTRLSPANRKRILTELGGETHLYNALHEIAHNTLKGRVKLNPNQKRKLTAHKRTLTNLCDSKYRKCSKKRKQLISQSGGFLPILIPAIASILGSVVGNL